METILFYILLYLVAFLYASVGHGGASGYLALMALFEVTPEVMKPTALLLNLFVSAISFSQFYRGGHFRLQLFWPFAVASVPMAYLGGLTTLDGNLYKKILAFALLIPVARFILVSKPGEKDIKKPNLLLSLVIGGLIGYLSGLIGIGGGIILSPVLLLLGWANMKQTAAVSALFIFVNSLSGLAGQLKKGIYFSSEMYWYVGVALAGGLMGAYFGAIRFNQSILRYLLAMVLLVAIWKLLFTNA